MRKQAASSSIEAALLAASCACGSAVVRLLVRPVLEEIVAASISPRMSAVRCSASMANAHGFAASLANVLHPVVADPVILADPPHTRIAVVVVPLLSRCARLRE